MSEVDDDPEELPKRLTQEAEWRWLPGMRTLGGQRLVAGGEVASDALPDLSDWPTIGAILGLIAAYGALSDLVLGPEGWVVAVVIDGDLTGYAADNPGDAAAWALLAVLENLPVSGESA